MKKFISILIALVITLSLTACSNSNSGSNSENSDNKTNTPLFEKATLNKYVNESALTNTNNITFYIRNSENENEEYFLNINAPDMLKNLSATINEDGSKASRMFNDIINLRLFSNSDSLNLATAFTFKGYGEIYICHEKDETHNSSFEIVEQDGCLRLERKDKTYRVAFKDGNTTLSIIAECLDGKHLDDNQDDITTFYNLVKSHFTFAKIKTQKVVKDGMEFNTYDLKNTTILNGNKSNDIVKDWVFACDILHKQLDSQGIPLITSYCLTSGGRATWAEIRYELTNEEKNQMNPEPKAYLLSVEPVSDRTPLTFDELPSETEFSIGNIQIRRDEINKMYYGGKSSVGLVFKNEAGEEYSCSVSGRGNRLSKELSIEEVKEVLEKMISK